MSGSTLRCEPDLRLVDEYQLCVHPVVAGGGLALFENVKDRVDLRLVKTKTFASGAVVLCYEPVRVWVVIEGRMTRKGGAVFNRIKQLLSFVRRVY